MEDTWGSSSLGIFLLTASVGRFIIQRLRVGHQQRRGSYSVCVWGGAASYEQASLLLHVFFSSL